VNANPECITSVDLMRSDFVDGPGRIPNTNILRGIAHNPVGVTRKEDIQSSDYQPRHSTLCS